jgi:hypothetical protein
VLGLLRLLLLPSPVEIINPCFNAIVTADAHVTCRQDMPTSPLLCTAYLYARIMHGKMLHQQPVPDAISLLLLPWPRPNRPSNLWCLVYRTRHRYK